MKKLILSKEQVYELITANRYRVNPQERFLSRCIDGRYDNNIKNQISKIKSTDQKSDIKKQLPALAFPGADVGQLATILAAGSGFGFAVDGKNALKALLETVGGVSNFGFHTDRHGDKKRVASGCGHWKQINLDPAAYSLEKAQIDFVQNQLTQLKNKGAEEIILEGDHHEGAVLMVKGNWGILPRFIIETDGGNLETQVFIYHQSLVDARHRALAIALLHQKAVALPSGCDEDYLYHTLSETAENHLMETAKRLAKGLPIFQVKFEEDGTFALGEVGKV